MYSQYDIFQKMHCKRLESSPSIRLLNLSDQANITLATGDHNFPNLPNFILAVESPDNHDVLSDLHTGDLKNNSDENSVTIATNEKHSLTFILNGAGLDAGIVETRSQSSDELPSTLWREYTYLVRELLHRGYQGWWFGKQHNIVSG